MSHQRKLKPQCKPDIQLKKTRAGIFDENSLEIIYSIGYQCKAKNLCLLNEKVLVLVAGNFLNFFNIETKKQTLLPSVYGAGFQCITSHPSELYLAAAEKGPNFCINLYVYPSLTCFGTLKRQSDLMICSSLKFDPKGEILISVSGNPENKMSIWLWEKRQHLFEASVHNSVYDIYFSPKENIFVTSCEDEIVVWDLLIERDEIDEIIGLNSNQTKRTLNQEKDVQILCTASLDNEYFVSGTEEGLLLVWGLNVSDFDVLVVRQADSRCHKGSIHCLITLDNLLFSFGADGYLKVWNFTDILHKLQTQKSESTQIKETGFSKTDLLKESHIKITPVYFYIKPINTFRLKEKSSLQYAILHKINVEGLHFFVQDSYGYLLSVKIDRDLKAAYTNPLLSGLGNYMTDMAVCPVFPLVVAASNFGEVTVYNCVSKTPLCSHTFSSPASTIIWPDIQVDGCGASVLVGFQDGLLRWLSLRSNNTDQKGAPSTELAVFSLQAFIKPHTDRIECICLNTNSTVLVSQGKDSKLFFIGIKKFEFIPLGFYINHHQIERLLWMPSTTEFQESLVMFCKHSYLLEIDTSDILNADLESASYFMKNNKWNLYRINKLLFYHELGDRIEDSDCEEIPDLSEGGKALLKKLKYEKKKKEREFCEKELGFYEPSKPPKIHSYLHSAASHHIWLSLGGHDVGYLFEFALANEFQTQVIDFIPEKALQVLTAKTIPIHSLKYSPCGHFLIMGLEDGSLNVCHMESPFDPSSGYDFGKYQLHDPDEGCIRFTEIPSNTNYIVTAADDGNIFITDFRISEQKSSDYGNLPVISNKINCLPEAVKMFEEKTTDLKDNITKKHERETVKTTMLQQKYRE